MIGHNTSEPVSKISVIGMKGQERHDRPGEVFDINLLDLFTSLGIGLLALGEALSGSLDFEFSTNAVDGCCRCPHTP